MKASLLKRAIGWLVLTVAGAIIGSGVTYALSHEIYPIWATIISSVTGKGCCYKISDPMPVDIFAGQMTKLIKTGYVISFSPEAAKVKIAAGVYECQESYFDVVKNVISRNSGNLQYSTYPAKKMIHITVKKDN